MTTQVNYLPTLNVSQLEGLKAAQASKCSFAHVLGAQHASQTSVSSRDVYPITGWVFESENCGQFTIGCREGQLVCNGFTADNQPVSFYGRFASNEAEFNQMMSDVKSGALDFFVKEGGVDHKFTAYFTNEGKVYSRSFDFTSHGPKNTGDTSFTSLSAFICHSQTYAHKYAVPVC